MHKTLPYRLPYVYTLCVSAVVAPSITELVPESGWTEVVEGDRLELTCRATGKPDPVISWTHRRHQFDADVIIFIF